MIEYRDINNPTDVVLIHSVAPHQPEKLCKVSPSTLLYVDQSTDPCFVRVLDCSGMKPKHLLGPHNIVHAEVEHLKSICYVQNGEKQVLMVAAGHLYAYDRVANKLIWIRERMSWNHKGARGVTSDGRGYVFVCNDESMSIEMYSVSDGKHLGCLIKNGEQGLGCPYRARWCEKNSSLIVAHTMGRGWLISSIHLQY